MKTGPTEAGGNPVNMNTALKKATSELIVLHLLREKPMYTYEMMSAVAQRSGYRLTVPSADDYQGDIDRIERAVRVPVMYAPHDFQHEALDTLPDRPVFRPDGSFYTTGRPDSIFLTLRAQEFENSMKAMSEAATRWSTAFVPELTAFEPIKDAEGGEITPEQQPAAIGSGHPSDDGSVFGQWTVTDNRAIHTPKDFAEEGFASFAVAP